MTLEEIKSELYKREAKKELLKHEESEFDPKSKLADPSRERFVVEDAWEEKKHLDKHQKRAIFIGAIFLAFIFLFCAGIYLAYLYNQDAFKEERVSLKINGPSQVESGKETDFEIDYKNDNRIALANAVVWIYFPENFEPEPKEGLSIEGTGAGKFELGKIEGHKGGRITFSGKSFNPKGSLTYMKSDISYKPEGINSQFSSNDQLSMEVKYSPIDLQVVAPLGIPSGNLAGYSIKYRNGGNEDFENVEIKVELPAGFTFVAADPYPSGGKTVWQVGKLSVGQSGEIILRGNIYGEKDDVKVMRAEIGVLKNGEFISYNKEKASTKIEKAPMSLSQTINGKREVLANIGDNLTFLINYKNEGDLDLGNIIVTEKIDSPFVDYQKMNLNGGSFDVKTKTITWKASDHRDLENLPAGKEGNISFNIRIKDYIPADGSKNKNLTISGIAKADSPDIPIPLDSNKIVVSNEINIKVISKINIQAEGYYNDKILENFGPIPPAVGKETAYAIHWKLFNTYNDLDNAIVETTLPTGVVMTGLKSPASEDLTYNERNNNLIWNVGKLPAGTGFAATPREVVFQVKVIPNQTQIGKPVPLLSPVIFSGQDSFTGQNLSVNINGKTTELKEDLSTQGGAGRVIP